MKRFLRWTVAAALAAFLSASLAGVGVAQDAADQKAKAEAAAKVAEVKKATGAKKAAIAKKIAEAKKTAIANDGKKVTEAKQAEQAKKQHSAQETKLLALRKSVDELMAKRKALLQSAEKDAPQVEKITAQIEKITQRAQQMRPAAKPAAPKIVKKSDAVTKDDVKVHIAKAKVAAEKAREAQGKDAKRDSEVAELVRGLGLKSPREKSQVQRSQSAEKMKQRGELPLKTAQAKKERVQIESGREEIPQRVRVANDRERDMQSRQNARSPGSADRPGPMEVTRRLQVLEDRLNSIERKLDQLLQQVSRRGGGPAGQPVGRGPGIGGGGPPGAPPQMRNEGPSRRGPGPDGPPSDRRPEPGFGNPDGGPPQMRNENDGQDRARRPRNAEGREGQRPEGTPAGARDVPPPPDSPDAPRRRERTPPDDRQGPRGGR